MSSMKLHVLLVLCWQLILSHFSEPCKVIYLLLIRYSYIKRHVWSIVGLWVLTHWMHCMILGSRWLSVGCQDNNLVF